MISLGAMYYLIPRLYGREIWSVKLIELHFWTSTIGIVLYISAMWVSGIMQGLMWRAVNPDGTLTYSFVESVQAMHPYYILRFAGGALFLTGTVVMAYNIYRSIAGARSVTVSVPQPALAH